MFDNLATYALMQNDMVKYAAFKNLETKEEESVKNVAPENTKRKVSFENIESSENIYTQKALKTIREMYN